MCQRQFPESVRTADVKQPTGEEGLHCTFSLKDFCFIFFKSVLLILVFIITDCF